MSLRGWVAPVIPQSHLIWEEFPHWHRYKRPRQTCNKRHLCLQPKSHLRGIWAGIARPILSVFELDPLDLSRRRPMALPAPDIARRTMPERSLRPAIFGVLRSSEALSLKEALPVADLQQIAIPRLRRNRRAASFSQRGVSKCAEISKCFSTSILQ